MQIIRNLFVFVSLLFSLLYFSPERGIEASSSQQSFDCSTVSEVPVLECQALVALYSDTDGINWLSNTGWLTNNQICSWKGVECLEEHVLSLKLPKNNLQGQLPSSLGDLENIVVLDLSQNNLAGSIPSSFGSLSKLFTLHLDSNQLTGTIPEELGQLLVIKYMWLTHNQLSGSVPATLGNLSKLKVLSLSNNQLSGTLPARLGELTDLEDLFLYQNNFNGPIPAELGTLTNLTRLFLHDNQLSGEIPAQLGNLAQLTDLSIGANLLTGTIPAELGKLTNLTGLWLYSNRLAGRIPTELGNLTKLEELELVSNALSGTIPPNFVSLSALTELYLNFNSLYAEEDTLANFLEEKNPGWQNMQTISPSNVQVVVPPDTEDSVTVTWQPIAYQPEGGYYEIALKPKDSSEWVVENTVSLGSQQYEVKNLERGIQYDLSIRSHAQPHTGFDPAISVDDQRNALWSARAQDSFIIPGTSTELSGAYEPNNACNLAESIDALNGEAQEHTFGTSGDIDWVRFDATANTEYRIEITVPPDSLADADSEIYPTCNSQPDEREWSGTFGPGSRISFTALQDGPVYLKLLNNDDSIYGPDVSYRLSVRSMSEELPSRALIIVAGRLKQNDRLQKNIHNVTDRVNRLFESNGYTKEDIYYLATDSDLPGHDELASRDSIRRAITEWAMERLDNDGVLTVYIMDHGDPDKLYIDGPRNEILTPEDLNQWLTQLETAKSNLKVNVFLEACHIGSFIEGDASISKKGRVIITSTNVEWDAYASSGGAYFSDYFLTSLWQGRNLFESFFEARRDVENLLSYQKPWLDANGNKVHNELEDWDIASGRGFAHAGTLSNDDNWQPHIAQTTGRVDLDSNSGIIRAEVRDDGRIDDVWAVVYPPSYVPQESRTGELVQETLQTLKLLPTGDGQDEYSAEYAAFNERGTYRVVIHAKDITGLLARPKVLDIVVGTGSVQLFLPVIMR